MLGHTGEGVECRQRWRLVSAQRLPAARRCPSYLGGRGMHYFYPTRILEIGLKHGLDSIRRLQASVQSADFII